ncbi:MAG: CPBP family intramembrane metalloprotease [Phycisphaerales bacterium]|nr:MAG: CPBP family intramembrane metalloprotease [Phycisphaerales bacterium]
MYGTLLTRLLHLATITPLVVIALRRRERRNIQYVLLFALFFLTGSLLRGADFLGWGAWNWEGKFCVAVFAIVFVLLYRKISFAESGVTWRHQPSSLRPCLVLTTFYVAAGFGIGSLTDSGYGFSTEFLFFELSMPGLDEEIFYRGVGLALLNRAFGKNRNLFGANVGWGLIIISVLFGLVHGVGLTEQLKLEIDLFGVLLTAGAGFLLGWLRERSGSLVLPIAAHNLGNTATRVAEWII